MNQELKALRMQRRLLAVQLERLAQPENIEAQPRPTDEKEPEIFKTVGSLGTAPALAARPIRKKSVPVAPNAQSRRRLQTA